MKNVFVFALIFLFCSIKVNAQTPAQTIPNFTFSKLTKAPFTNTNLAHNKLLFFFFFDPDCDHCQRAAGYLNKEYDNYKNVAVYLISVASADKINAFINQYLQAFRNKPNVTVLQDVNNEFITKFQPTRYPAMFLYSTQQKLLDYEDNAESTFRFLKPIKTSIK